MRAYVIAAPGGAEALELREVPRPEERPGWVLIRVKAFGLNRSEWFTRRGADFWYAEESSLHPGGGGDSPK